MNKLKAKMEQSNEKRGEQQFNGHLTETETNLEK
jgi:hypothetical protein